jgi:HK97 gp10 family phage protein
MDAAVKLTGVEELEKRLSQLEFRIGRRAASRALRKGANVIRDIARQNAQRIDDPETREVIAKNITTQAGSSRRQKAEKAVIMRVGVMGGARLKRGDNGAPGGNTTYWRMVEFGTSDTKAQPFLRPAIASGAERAISTVIAALGPEIDKEVAKLGVPSGS